MCRLVQVGNTSEEGTYIRLLTHLPKTSKLWKQNFDPDRIRLMAQDKLRFFTVLTVNGVNAGDVLLLEDIVESVWVIITVTHVERRFVITPDKDGISTPVDAISIRVFTSKQ